jgi:hypothetical protein
LDTALSTSARIVVRTSSILNGHVQLLRSLRRRAASAWGKFIAIEPRALPEPERDWKRIDVELLPPCDLITRAMKLAVMDAANRDGELVAHSVSKPTRLGTREVMRIRRHAAAHKTRLPQYELPVLLIAQPDAVLSVITGGGKWVEITILLPWWFSEEVAAVCGLRAIKQS